MEGLRKIQPYIPGEQVDYQRVIKLNTNEHAYLPSPKIKETLATFDLAKLQRYSSVDNQALCRVIAQNEGLEDEWITTANGSDDILALAFQSFFQTKAPIIFPDITYGFYPVWCELYQIPYQLLPLDDQFQWDFTKIPQAIGGLVLTNPNAPTGKIVSKQAIIDLLERFPEQVIIVDEAYQAFNEESVAPLVSKYPNLYVTRTLSKDHALAGLRVGYGIGSPRLTQVIKAVKNSYNPYAVDALAEAVAITALEDRAYYQKVNQQILHTRSWFSEQLTQLGFNTLESHTNFVLTTHPSHKANILYQQLKEHAIYVRYFDTLRLKDYLRISIGTQQEMEQVTTLLRELTQKEI